MFFSEEKNQKTFVSAPVDRYGIWPETMMRFAILLAALATPASAANIHGKILFLRCASCHDISAAPSMKIGPNLKGVVGRPSGSLPGYTYSTAMKKAHLVWDAPTLDKWLASPNALVPGTAMAFAGLPSEADRQAVIAYLQNPGP
jgi:cytochrome c